jgi:UDP-glucose 6-dehydrogenase
MEKFIKSAELFLKENRNYLDKFPKEISAPIMAHFAHSVITNDLNLSKEDLAKQARIFLLEEELEEINYCIENFINAMVEFTSSFIGNQTETHQIKC